MATTRYTTRIRTCTNWRPTMPSAPLLWVFPLFFFFFCNIKYNKHDFKLRLTITNQNSILENDHPSTSWIPQPIATLFSSGPLTLFFFFFWAERGLFLLKRQRDCPFSQLIAWLRWPCEPPQNVPSYTQTYRRGKTETKANHTVSKTWVDFSRYLPGLSLRGNGERTYIDILNVNTLLPGILPPVTLY